MLLLIIWLIPALGVALGLMGGGPDRVAGKLMAGWWVFAAGVLTCLAGGWLVDAGYLGVEDVEYFAFQLCGGVLILAGTILGLLGVGQLVRRYSQELQELRNAAAAKSQKPEKIPAWKRVEDQ